MPQDSSIEYRILNFITVFSTIATFVKCKTCNSDIKFQTANMRGLGFKIAVICDNCALRLVPPCSFIGHSYEINRRFVFTMRILGLELKGCEKFCGLMDMPNFLSQPTYDLLINNIHPCVLLVRDKLFTKAVNEEMEEISNETNIKNNKALTVAGDGTWKKRGFTSLYGIASIIRYYTGKVLDIVAKSAFCKMCEVWEKKKGSAEYEEWRETHGLKCIINHQGSSGKMEVDTVVEMVKRSETLHDVKYANYIGDGDSKTYNGIINSSPYDDITVNKRSALVMCKKEWVADYANVKKNIKNSVAKEN